MPESKIRKAAAEKKLAKREAASAERRANHQAKAQMLAGSRDWVPWVFVPMGLLGVLWLLVFYVAGYRIGFMTAIGNWNYAVGLGLIAGSFVVSTMWK